MHRMDRTKNHCVGLCFTWAHRHLLHPDNPYGISPKAKRGINAPTVNADDYHHYPGLDPEPEDKW